VNKEQILNLAKLARLELTDAEVDKYATEIGSILGYVEQINSAVSNAKSDTIETSGDRNIFREDINPDSPETHTDLILACAPHTKDNFIKVQKILNTDDGSN
jgi:aspartyl-tRNA(Asn)/glutamyl-tRNA(Gln) amidotransferase subunit C